MKISFWEFCEGGGSKYFLCPVSCHDYWCKNPNRLKMFKTLTSWTRFTSALFSWNRVPFFERTVCPYYCSALQPFFSRISTRYWYCILTDACMESSMYLVSLKFRQGPWGFTNCIWISSFPKQLSKTTSNHYFSLYIQAT